MDLGLRDRVLVVSGASRGLGRATAEVLLAEGACVVAAARDADAVNGAIDSVESEHAGRVVGVPCDLADPASADLLVATALSRFGRLDGALVNGPSPAPGSSFSIPEEQWRTDFEAIVLGAVRLVGSVAAAASAAPDGSPAGTGCSIALVLSASARRPLPGLSVSNALRPGLASMVCEWAAELGPRGVRVNGLLPGRLATERVRGLDEWEGDPAEARRRHESTIPLGRYGDSAEFGRAAAFILSPAASYISGALIPVDGGLLRSP